MVSILREIILKNLFSNPYLYIICYDTNDELLKYLTIVKEYILVCGNNTFL